MAELSADNNNKRNVLESPVGKGGGGAVWGCGLGEQMVNIYSCILLAEHIQTHGLNIHMGTMLHTHTLTHNCTENKDKYTEYINLSGSQTA